MELQKAIQTRRLFFDGGTGTVLQGQGLLPGQRPEEWNRTHPAKITALHRAYLDAGCQILKANTFGVNALRFPGRVDELVSAALDCAEAALAPFRTRGEDRYLVLDLGPCGKLLKPLGDLEFEDAVALFAEVVEAGKDRVDGILIETMNDAYETKAAVLAAKEHSELPVLVTNVYDEGGKLLTGATPEVMVSLLEGLGVDALGMNCSLGPVQMEALLPRFLACASVPVIVNPNAGLPREEHGVTVFDVGPEAFSESMVRMAAGARLLGGCCGTTPDYLAQTIRRVEALPVPEVTKKDVTAVCSGSRAVVLGNDPVLIGERINPTGKKRLRQALLENDVDYVLRLAAEQEEAGAQILDLNVGLPELDEATVLPALMAAVQEITPLPVQLDSSNPAALEAALRRCNGKPLVNSVNGKTESLHNILPLVKKYGGVLVALLLDEAGIPETADGRMEIARRILRAAEDAGLARKDLIFDPLALTVSADSRSAGVALDCVRRIRAELGCRTILGVSNISFGLPQREKVTAAFFAMAIREGLSAAIMNPLSRPMMDTWYASRVLCGYDAGCRDYLAAMQTAPSEPVPASHDLTLELAIVKGLRSHAAQLAAAALKEGAAPMDLIQGCIVPALDQVGQAFEAKRLYLPQLLMSAEAASAAFGVLRQAMAGTNRAASEETVLLATVRGDIHDIGKNIVRVLLENYGFRVIDLGRDVAPEAIVDRAARDGVRLIGLSALMTTTVPAMAETIALVHERLPGAEVVVGGAVLTPSYAKSIGADYYAKDAMQTVRIAERFFGRCTT